MKTNEGRPKWDADDILNDDEPVDLDELTARAAFELEAALARAAEPVPDRPPGGIKVVPELPRTSFRERETAKAFEGVAGRWLEPVECADPPAVRAILAAEFPWAVGVVDELLAPTFRGWSAGRPVVKVGPAILVGPPGTGKSRIARRLCEFLGVPWRQTSVAASFDDHLLGLSKGWSSAMPSVVLELVAASQCPNPVVVLDEIEKTLRTHGDMPARLLPLLEPSEACRWTEPLLGVPIDASHVNWVFTANSLSGLPAPFISRMRVLHVPAPGPEHALSLARTIIADIAAERGLHPAWYEVHLLNVVALLRPRLAEHKSARLFRRQLEAALNLFEGMVKNV